MVWFSHLCGDSEIIALRKADLIVAKSKHGRKILQELGFHHDKIRIFPGIGSSTDNFKKIKIGFAGRLCYKNRKGEDELRKLVETLDRRIFKFYLLGKDRTLVDFYERISRIGDAEIIKEDAAYFFNEIDYFLQASHIEGGSMDIVNAINTGTPIISRDIGFYYDFKTAEDYTYENYEQLLKYFKKKEAPKLLKLEQSKINTWNNFLDWHKSLFKEIYGRKKS